jgi:hypothetical protein
LLIPVPKPLRLRTKSTTTEGRTLTE